MNKLEQLEKAKAIVQQEIDTLKAAGLKSDNETETLLDADAETIEGGFNQNDKETSEDSCGFFCLTGTFN